MALMHGAYHLPIHSPIPPDRFFCHPDRGRTLMPVNPDSCQWAVNENWPNGRTPIRYFMKDPRPSQGEWIPNYAERFSCRVAIEAAGPYEHLPHSVLLSPQKLRGLAGFIIQKCAIENQGLGGFVTMGLESALAYTHNPENGHWGGNFLTVSIRSSFPRGEDTIEPGNRDENIAALLSAYTASFVPDQEYLPQNTWYHYAVSEKLRSRALEMGENYNPDLTWWSKNGVWDWWATRYNHTLHLWTPNDGRRPATSIPTQMGNRWNESATNTSSSPGEESPLRGNEGGGEGEGAGGEAGGDSENGDGSETDISDGDDTDSSRTITAANILMSMSKPGEDTTNDTIEAVDADVGDMTYQCDDSLGSDLSPIDCEKLSWSGLKPPDSIETLQPGVPKFYSQGTCALGVSSLTPTTIMWAHLLAAFDALNTLCVQNPIKSVKGGRAYFGRQSVESWINGKVKKDSVDSSINGTDALPRGINATLFKHDPKSQLAYARDAVDPRASSEESLYCSMEEFTNAGHT